MPGTIVTPGWLAMKLAPFGTQMALAVLGAGLTLHDGKASDEEIDAWYAELEATPDTVFMLNQHYVALEAAYPYLLGYLRAITSWTEDPQIEHWEQTALAAAALRGIAWSQCEHKDEGDLLGMVYNQMISIGARRTRVFNFVTPQEIVMEIMLNPSALATTLRLGSFTDAWCGSGTRVIAVHDLLMVFDRPTNIAWRLNDPNPMAIAMAGLNMVSHSIGPDVELRCDIEYAQAWGATSLYARHRPLLRQIPPEVADDVPGVLDRSDLGS